MKNTGIPRSVWGLLFLCAVVFASVFSQSLSELERQRQQTLQQQKANQQRIEKLNRELANLDALTAQRLRDLRALEGQIQRLEKERADLGRQIDLLQQQVRETEAEIARNEAQLAELKKRLATLIQSLYREQAGRYLPLLQAQSFTDLSVRAKWVGYLGNQQTSLIQRINFLLEQLDSQKQRLILLVRDLNAKQADRQNKINELSASRSQLQATLAALRQQAEGRKVLLRESLLARNELQNQLNSVVAAITKEQRRLAEERRRREEEARRQREREAAERRRQQLAAQQNNSDQEPAAIIPNVVVGALQFPVPGGRIVVPFGLQGTYQVIQGPGDFSPVVAAASGVVLDQYPVSNTGWWLIIAHGNVTSFYIGLQSPLVQKGQQVSKGQRIGYTGGAALIPADTLWFAVANDDGVQVDPSRYY
jgi:septal ring factor EnvC (AmiA/AmiB activator)